MIKSPDNLIPPDNKINKLYSPNLKPKVLDHINNLKNKLKVLAN
jgi:hypothetical protein